MNFNNLIKRNKVSLNSVKDENNNCNINLYEFKECVECNINILYIFFLNVKSTLEVTFYTILDEFNFFGQKKKNKV